MTDPQDSGRDRRRYYRIDDDVALSYREVSEEELASTLERVRDGHPDLLALASSFATTSSEMSRTRDKLRREIPEVARYLEHLNDKLDTLIRLLAMNEVDLPSEPSHRVSLSASGVSFPAPEALEPGTLVELKLLVFPSYLCVHTFGTVVHCDHADGGGSQLGVEFAFIHEDDRELLIRHVLQKQSYRLRATRGDPEDDE